MTRTLAVEWASLGIRVNCITPGPFDSKGAAQNLWPDEKAKQALLRSIPTGRFVDIEEVSRHVLYVASPLSSGVNGECFVMDGGQSLGKPWSDKAGM